MRLNKTGDVETQAVTYMATADHFPDTCVSAWHSVMPSQHFDTGSPVPSLVLARDVPLAAKPRQKQMWQAAENQLIRADVCQ